MGRQPWREREYDKRLSALKVASRTIGSTAAARLEWIVRFVNEHSETWTPAQRTAHGDCLAALADPIPPNLVGGIELPDPLLPSLVNDLHRELRAMLRDLLTKNPTRGGQIVLVPPASTEGIVRLTRTGDKPVKFAVSHGHEHARSAVFAAVRDLIPHAGDRLLGCPACTMPFIAVSKQRFCSTRCAQRVRNRRRRGQSG